MKKLLVFLVLSPILASAQFGELDLNFDGDGMQTLLVNTATAELTDIKVLPDGKILACGFGGETAGGETAGFVYRLFPDGSIDNTFGINGQAGFAISDTSLRANAMDLTSDGDIMLASTFNSSGSVSGSIVIKLNGNDGSLSTGFGSNGIQIIPQSGFTLITDIIVSSNGKINVAGYRGSSLYGARFNGDGSFDNSFSFDGEVTVAVTQAQFGWAMTIDNEEKMIIAGAINFPVSPDYVLVRLNPDGTLDDSFGINGVVRNDASTFADEFFGVSVDADGKYVAVGYQIIGPNDKDLLVVRFNNDGSIDNSFNGNGIFQLDFNGAADIGNDVIFQPDGKILVCGEISPGIFESSSFITRITSDGQLDQTFGNGGTSILEQNNFIGSNRFEAMSLQEDLKMLAVGSIDIQSGRKGLVTRYTSGLNVGIGEVETYIGFTLVYPNPITDNQVTVEYELKSAETVSIDLFDLAGKHISLLQPKTEQASGSYQKTLRIPTLSAGNYLLNLNTEKGSVSVKLTIN